ncbi:MAG: CotH kinase family protein [Dysgonamonadaceae bacterium]|jgi:hypothetical protein|nr:CotH kinase family protein [Dysgonamonadaceae bacterium]
MKQLISIAFFLTVCININAQGTLKISEIMSNNVSALMDESYNYSMWVELYNSGSGTVSLNNYYFTDDLAQPKKWNPQNQQISAGQFKVLWFERDELPGHSSFKLEPDGGKLYLLDANAYIVDQVTYPKQYRNVSYGRTDNVGNQWAFFTESSPNASNTGKKSGELPVCRNPIFSYAGGFYKSPINLTLSTTNVDVKIYYTTNGSEPTTQSNLYVTGQNIALNKTTCVRAIVVSNKYLPSPIITNTYFINERDFTLPVVSLVTEEKNLKDNTIGIYVEGTNGIPGKGSDKPVNWNQSWCRPTNMEFFDTIGITRINQEIDISISGGWSRMNPQKSLKLQPRKKFGNNRLRHDFFYTKLGNKYKDILFRDSGNDFWYSMMRDAMMQSLIIGRMDIDYQAYEPAICFINGEYYGVQNLRERTNKDYLYSNYDLSEEEFVLLKTSTNSDYESLLSYLRNNNPNTPSVYENIAKQMDIDSYSYYMMAEMYYNDTDWPHNNWKIWKKNDGTGKWRWILYDTDFGFNLYGTNEGNDAVTYVMQSSDGKITTPLRRLVLNTDFKNRFLTRYAIHLSSTFDPDRVIAVIDSLSAKIRPEMVYHKQKYGGNSFEGELNRMKSFARVRQGNMMQFLSAYFLQSAPIRDIYIRSNNGKSTYLFNNEIIKDNTIRMKYFSSQQVNIKASDVPGHYFSHWEITGLPSEQLAIPTISSWRYWDKEGLPATNWNSPSYDDSAWKTGDAPLGYANPGAYPEINTTIGYGGNPNNKYPTAYFRKTITLNNLNDLSDFRINCYVDDGAAMYVNGKEVGRVNLPAGPLTYNTFAIDVNNGISGEWSIPKSYFQEGVNTIAAEVHQCNASSSDLLFSSNLFYQTYPQTDIQQSTAPVYSFVLSDNISLTAIYKSTTDIQNAAVSTIKAWVADNVLHVENATGKALCIYDLTGRPIQKASVNGNNMLLDISSLQPGMYIVAIDNQSFKVIRQ